MPKETIVFIDSDLLTRYVAKSMTPESVFVEVGTFTGESGREFRALANLKPDHCHLIEACPDNYEILKKNSPGYHVYNLAIADRIGTLPFYVVNNPSDDGTSRSNSFDRAHLEKRWGKENVKEIQVRAIDMNTFMNENKIDSIDYLFFNCEGAEYGIMRGNLDFLQNVRFFNLDMHHRNIPGLKQSQQELYDRMVSLGFTRIGGHRREDIPFVNNHLTFLWERNSK